MCFPYCAVPVELANSCRAKHQRRQEALARAQCIVNTLNGVKVGSYQVIVALLTFIAHGSRCFP